MRIRPPATQEQRSELKAVLQRFERPEVVLDLARRCLNGGGIEPATFSCTLQSRHPDRFVMRMQVRSGAGEERDYALKVYADDFGEQMWTLGNSLAERLPRNHDGLWLPCQYMREARTLVFAWVKGTRLSEIVDERKPELLRRAATLAARLHRTLETAVPTLTVDMVVAETLDRCGHLCCRGPSLEVTVRPLARLLQRAAAELDPARPTLIHGDLAAGQFLWTGDRLVLLDMDTACRGDAAYDVGHFLGQLERGLVTDDGLPAHAASWPACFRDAYPAAELGVSWRNVAFYQGVTLLRKAFTLCQRDPVGGPRLAVRLAERARAALESVAAPVSIR